MTRRKKFQCKHMPDADVLRWIWIRWEDQQIYWTSGGNVRWLMTKFPDAHENVVYAKLFRLVDRGLLEYGCSIRGSWLTDKGKALIGVHDEDD